jgi:hypothetical protein
VQRRLRRLILDPQEPQRHVSVHRSRRAGRVGRHEASVSRIGEEQLFYLMSRGLSEAEASTMIVNGFIEPLVKELPMEYAVEMNRLIQLQMEGSVGRRRLVGRDASLQWTIGRAGQPAVPRSTSTSAGRRRRQLARSTA